MNDDLIGAYEEPPYPSWRTLTEDTLRHGKVRHHVPVLLEVDVTAARAALAGLRQQGGSDLSFTAWAVKCIAQAVAEHKRVHAVRGGRAPGRRRLVVFDDVDMCLAVYRRMAGDETDERLPMPFVVRAVSRKSLAQVNEEIRGARSRPLPADQQWLDPVADVPPPWLVRLGLAAPRRLRDWLYWEDCSTTPCASSARWGR